MVMKKIQTNFKQIKDIIFAILITFLFMFPLLKQLKLTYVFSLKYDYISLILVGFFGLFSLIVNIYLNFEKSTDKKHYLKSISPILILFFFMLWTLISATFAENKFLAFYGTSTRHDGYLSYLAYAGCFGLAYSISSKKIKKLLLYLFVIIASLLSISIQLTTHRIFCNIFLSLDIKCATFLNSNHYGYYLLIATAISSFLFITEKNKLLKILTFLLYAGLLYHLIINDTFGCYLALILTLIIFLIITFIKKEEKLSIIILIMFFILMSIFTNTNNRNIAQKNIKNFNTDISNILSSKDDTNWKRAGSGRIELWIQGLHFFIQNPILGYGPENLGSKYAEVGITIDRPHNLLIQLVTTSGLPGLVLYILAIGIILLRSIKNLDMKETLHVVTLFSVISYLISSMFGNSMYYTSPYYFILLGFLVNEFYTYFPKDRLLPKI